MEFSDVVKRIVSEYASQHMNTSVPARVISVENFAKDQTVDVLPIINDTFADGTVLELPPILDVPVQFPSAGGGLLSFPVVVNDIVLLVFSKKSIDEWMASRDTDLGTFTPTDKRTYHLNDAIAIPGIYARKTNLSPNPTDVEMKFKGMSFKLEATGDMSLTNGPASSSVVLASSGDVTLTNSGGSATLANSGAITLTNSSGSVTLADTGLITLANASGSIVLNLDGSVAFGNGAAISAAGELTNASGISLGGHIHTQGNDNAGDVQAAISAGVEP
jgi:hypothetical protein